MNTEDLKHAVQALMSLYGYTDVNRTRLYKRGLRRLGIARRWPLYGLQLNARRTAYVHICSACNKRVTVTVVGSLNFSITAERVRRHEDNCKQYLEALLRGIAPNERDEK